VVLNYITINKIKKLYFPFEVDMTLFKGIFYGNKNEISFPTKTDIFLSSESE
jgi:hypothetical protein